MSAFWSHLQRLAQGQLFAGGYLSRARDVERTVENRCPGEAPRERTIGARERLPHTQIAAYR